MHHGQCPYPELQSFLSRRVHSPRRHGIETGSAAPYGAHQTIVSNRTKKYVRNPIKLGQMSKDLIAIISYAHLGS